MADSEWTKPRGQPVPQATEAELAQARQMRITRKTHPLEDPRDATVDWRNVQVRIDHEVLRDWLGMRRRASDSPIPSRRCGHCRVYAISPVEWRPANPLMMLLCSQCRSEVYRLAEETATRTGRRLSDHLDALLKALCLAD